MADSSFARADEVKTTIGEGELRSRIASARPAQPLALSDGGFDLIAEAKLASPSEGRIAGSDENVVQLAKEMASAGAAAVSVLTEPDFFGGSIEHLENVAASINTPAMRKDFLVDPIQVLEARAHGGSGVLLISRMVGRSRLLEMTDLALDLGMFALIEVFGEADLDVAGEVFDRSILVGVNARDLSTLEVVPARHAELIPMLPTHLPSVAESGIRTAVDAHAVSRLGYDLALVGSSLVGSGRPSELTDEMIAAGR